MIRAKNSVVIIGNVVDMPQIGFGGSERNFKIANIRVATSEEYKTQNGSQKHVEYHRVVAYRVLAEMIERSNLKKGQKVCVFGKIRSSSYSDKEGVKRTSFQIEAEDVFLHVRENSGYTYGDDMDSSAMNDQEPADGIPYK